MATEKIRVGIIGASMRNGWGRDAHIPALSALPEFEITAVSTSRQETADETAKHFGIPHAFADPYKMVQHPDVDLVSICVRVPFHHQLGMAAIWWDYKPAGPANSIASGTWWPRVTLARCFPAR